MESLYFVSTNLQRRLEVTEEGMVERLLFDLGARDALASILRMSDDAFL